MNINEIKKCICKIETKNWGEGTGFFCIISNNQKELKVLITNNHILEKLSILPYNRIKLSLNNGNISKNILIDKSRKIYTHSGYDITIVEIKESDGLNEDLFLKLYNGINNDIDNIIKEKKDIYLLYYAMGIKELKKSDGLIKAINKDNSKIEHFCYCDVGAGGGPLICSYNNKVIGIHKGKEVGQNWNLGTLLEEPIKEFFKEYEEFLKCDNLNNKSDKSKNIKYNKKTYNNKFNNNKFNFHKYDYDFNKYYNENNNYNKKYIIIVIIFIFFFFLKKKLFG